MKAPKKVSSATRYDSHPFGIEHYKDFTNGHAKLFMWFDTYEERDEVFTNMYATWKTTLSTTINTNGMDYASCPNCKHYNAMMPDDYDTMPADSIFVCTCRDCGYQCLVSWQAPVR